MSDTQEFRVDPRGLDAETALALLGELPFAAFRVDGADVLAYAEVDADLAATRALLLDLAGRFGWASTERRIAERNWNAEWEAGFAPVEVGGFLRIRAPFHAPAPDRFRHELEIVPEMSFGTGHHATTYLMCELLRDRPPRGRHVFDFGCGTGVLALVAALLGASGVVAVDHDPRCVESTRANAARNGVGLATVSVGSATTVVSQPYDLILANINRAVLLNSMPALARQLAPAGALWLSGILTADISRIDAAAEAAHLTRTHLRERDGWLACTYSPQV